MCLFGRCFQLTNEYRYHYRRRTNDSYESRNAVYGIELKKLAANAHEIESH